MHTSLIILSEQEIEREGKESRKRRDKKGRISKMSEDEFLYRVMQTMAAKKSKYDSKLFPM